MTNFARPRSSMLAVSAAVLLALSGAVSAEDVARDSYSHWLCEFRRFWSRPIAGI